MVYEKIQIKIHIKIHIMTRRKSHEENIRKISKSGASYSLTIPISVMRELGWREKQKVVVEKRGIGFVVKDFK